VAFHLPRRRQFLFYGLLPMLNWPSQCGKKSLPRSQWNSLRYIPWSVFVTGTSGHSSYIDYINGNQEN
jgi:hypothetical protein